ncbi:MAG TPA: exostosin family protein [Coleofasciculaceae cyanobacterium]
MPDIDDPKKTQYLQELASIAQPKIHTIVDNIEQADIIIITHAHLMNSSLKRFLTKHLDKCYVINNVDDPLFFLSGLYINANKSFSFLHKPLMRGCAYLYELYQGNQNRNQFINFSHDANLNKKYLFSFIGASTSWTRKRLLKLNFQRDDILIRCTNKYNHWNVNQQNRKEMQKNYVDIIQKSKFAVCPKGAGLGCIRLYEVMKLGVAPIIISDQWFLPMGPNWNSFVVFVKESEIKNIVEIVEMHASEYEERGRLARKTWEKYFSDVVVFNQCIEVIEDLKQNRIAILDRLFFYSYPIILTAHNLKKRFMTFVKKTILRISSKLKITFAYQLRSF